MRRVRLWRSYSRQRAMRKFSEARSLAALYDWTKSLALRHPFKVILNGEYYGKASAVKARRVYKD